MSIQLGILALNYWKTISQATSALELVLRLQKFLFILNNNMLRAMLVFGQGIQGLFVFVTQSASSRLNQFHKPERHDSKHVVNGFMRDHNQWPRNFATLQPSR